jgi:hypothetical protein
MAVLDYLTERGFVARKVGMHIRVSPASRLTPDVRQYIESHRNELLSDLPDSSPSNAAEAERPSVADRPLARPRLALVSSQYGYTNAAAATPEWRQARDLYVNHIMSCRSCYSPAGRHCRSGAELRAAYDQTPMEKNP